MALAMYEPAPLAPIHTEHLPTTPLPSPHAATKRLRSCLSPTRRYPCNPLDSIPLSQTSTISTDEPCLTRASSPMTSRTSSFSSCDEDRYWRRTKSVRWVDGEGCAMTAIYSTYSADDYDRSPLEPPKPEERACFLPARNTRCLSPATLPERAMDNVTYFSLAPQAEEEEWDECMDRRQLYAQHMLHMRSRDEDPEHRFEGYTSLSATLATLLHDTANSREPREVSTPMGSPQEDSPLQAAMGYMRRGSIDVIEAVAEEEEEEDAEQPSLETVMAALRAFRSGPGPLLGTGDEQRDTDE